MVVGSQSYTIYIKKLTFAQNFTCMNSLPDKPQRIEWVDALRGFAILCILLIHNISHFIYSVQPNPDYYPNWLYLADNTLRNVFYALFEGKAYAIFAMLFGFTFSLQYSRRLAKGDDFGYRFLWRLAMLCIFALINSLFFPGGDVLFLFAIVGIILFVLRKQSNRTILITVIVLLSQPLEWIRLIMSVLIPTYTPSMNTSEWSYMYLSQVTASGDIWNFFHTNIQTGISASLKWALDHGRFLQTAGLFSLGLLLERSGKFSTKPENQKFWTMVLCLSALCFPPLVRVAEQIMKLEGYDVIRETAGTVLTMWSNLSFALVLLSSFYLIYQTSWFQKISSPLRSYGKMSLSNYIFQSIIGAFLYYPIGLNLAPLCGTTLSLLIGVVTFFAQVVVSRWWLSHHKQGPFEALWHKLTWISIRKR